jgi:hypothetical protein
MPIETPHSRMCVCGHEEGVHAHPNVRELEAHYIGHDFMPDSFHRGAESLQPDQCARCACMKFELTQPELAGPTNDSVALG